MTRVAFVGAGPGAPDLITLAGAARLGAAEVVLYDDLAAPVLVHAAPGADLIAVGKRAGRPSPRQDHVSRLLVEHARTGARVVRLKAGDPGLFGRLEEEIAALRAAGIDYEIIPGVTAPAAAAAAAGIPLSRREAARRVQFVTGHDTTGALPDGLDWAALADPGAVTGVFMGLRTFPEMAARLMAAGLPSATPALVVESASCPEARVLRGTVGQFASAPPASGGGPVMILYGPLMGGE
ncbi:MAG: uroporphyrinogen-III C-methyltransferase [Rhodobacteraceae bacterium]|nr:uroporphyrinogen-III C-methyltransferase [Paracoccaceae bacterium]